MNPKNDNTPQAAPPPAPLPAPPPKRGGCLSGVLKLTAIAGILFVVLMAAGVLPGELPLWRDSVAVVYIEGGIYDSVPVTKTLRALREEPRIKALVLRVDSPGGSVGASEEIYRAVRRFRDSGKRPVIVSMGNAAASGGYLVSAAGNEIYTNAGTVTGSIGVIATGINVQRLMGLLGMEAQVIKTGDLKDSGTPFREWTPEERRALENLTFDMYRQFFSTVLRERGQVLADVAATSATAVENALQLSATVTTEPRQAAAFVPGTMAAQTSTALTAETLLWKVADGRVLTGQQALELGLVDKIGTLDDAVDRARELAGLDKEAPLVEKRPMASIPALIGVTARRAADAFADQGSRVQFREPME